jgi:hypothetical protein
VPIQDLDVIWDREVAYELLGERHLSDVIWDREVAHEMNISELNVLEEHAIGNGTLYMQTISAVSAEVEENMQAKDVRVGMTATRSIDGIVMEHATLTMQTWRTTFSLMTIQSFWMILMSSFMGSDDFS